MPPLRDCRDHSVLAGLVPGDGIDFKQDIEKWAEWPAPGCVAVSPSPVQSLFSHSVQQSLLKSMTDVLWRG